MFKLALAQMQVEGSAKEANLARAEKLIAESAAAGAHVVLLPEALNVGWMHRCPVARDFHLWIAGCSNVGVIDDGPWRGRKCIGSSYLINPTGAIAVQGPYGVDAETLLLVDVTPGPRPARGDQWAKRLA